MRSFFIVSALLLLLFALITVLLLPSPSTLDVSFESDVVEFQTDSALGHPLAFNPTNAVICGELDPRASATSPASACGLRSEFSTTSSAQVRIPPGTKAVLRRQNTHELELGFDVADSAHPIQVVLAGKESTTKSAYIHISKSFFDTGNVVALGAVVSMIRVGSPGRTFGQMNGLLLLNATLTPIAYSAVDRSIVRGDVVKLTMGDVIDYVAPNGSTQHANLFLRVSEKGEIIGTARIPITEITIRRLGGDGVPVSMSWWSRFLAEPILVAGWAAIGFLSAAFAVFGKLLASLKGRKAELDIS